jgi:hypothetical protein
MPCKTYIADVISQEMTTLAWVYIGSGALSAIGWLTLLGLCFKDFRARVEGKVITYGGWENGGVDAVRNLKIQKESYLNYLKLQKEKDLNNSKV